MLVFEIDRQTPGVADAQQSGLRLDRAVATLGRHTPGQFAGDRLESRSQDNVHHPLVGAVAISERRFFGQDINAQDRLGGQIAYFGKTRNAKPVQQHHRRPAIAPGTASCLWLKLGQQFADGADAVGANIAG